VNSQSLRYNFNLECSKQETGVPTTEHWSECREHQDESFPAILLFMTVAKGKKKSHLVM